MTNDGRNDSRINHFTCVARLLKDTASVVYTQKNRLKRHISKIQYTNNKEGIPIQYTKAILNLKSGNEQDMMYNSDRRNYYNYQEKNINGLKNDFNLNIEIESNSKPVTKNLRKSQERKRCIQKKLGSVKRQQSEELLMEDIEDKKICRDCKLIEQNINSEEPYNIYYNSSLRLKKNNDDYFINILKQLIEKLDKSNQSKSLSRKDLLVQKSNNEQLSLKNKSAENLNSSAEEELKLTFEKRRKKKEDNHIINKLDSNPENISINGMWVKNKLKGNNKHDYNPMIIDLRSELVSKNKTISRGDMNTFDDLINSNDKIIETNHDNSDNLNNLKAIVTQENKEVSISPILENNDHFLVTRETPKPFYMSAELKDKLDSTVIDNSNNFKFTDVVFTDPSEKKKNSNLKVNNINQKKALESATSATGNFQISSNAESIKDSKYDRNDRLKIKISDEVAKSNESNHDENNNSKEFNLISVKKENLNCSCNKKLNKNILSSPIMKNITEIRTDTYTSPKNLKVKSQNRSNKSQKTNNENTKENNTNESISIKNKNELDYNLIEKKQIPYIMNIKADAPKIKKLQKSVLTINNNSTQTTKDRKIKTNLQKILSENKSSYLKFEDQKKKNNNENTYHFKEIKNKRIPLIPKTLSQKYPRNYVIELKQNISRLPHTDMKNNYEKCNNKNKTNKNKSILMMNRTFKGLSQPQNKTVSQILPQGVQKKSRKHENLDENNANVSSKKVVIKFKYNAPKSSKIHTERNYGGYNVDDISVDNKISSVIVSPVSMQNINKPLSKTLSKKSKIGLDYSDVDVTKNSTRKLIVGSNMGKTVNENINNMKKPVNSRNNPLGLVKKIENIKSYTGPKNIPGIIENGSTDEKRINVNKTALQLNISKPIQFIRTSNPSNPLSITSQKQNNDITSNHKLKNSQNGKKAKDILFASNSNEKIPIKKYDIFDKPDLVLRNKNTFNNDKTTKSSIFIIKNESKPNVKKLKYEANLNELSKVTLSKVPQTGDDCDHEHAPYKYDDLEPIIFNESTEQPKLSTRNSRLFFQYPSQQPLYGNQFQNIPGSNLLKSVPINRPEDDDNRTRINNGGKVINIEKQQYLPEFNLSKYGLIEENTSISNFIKYDVKILDGKNFNQSRFEILPQLNVDNGLFKIPLLGYTDYDNNGSEYISDILIPIKKSNGQYTAISLTNLLTGDFHLLNKHNVNALAVDLSSGMKSRLSASQTSIDGTNSNKTGKLYDSIILKTFHENEEDNEQMVPIHIIQIINNGICSNNDTKIEKKHDRNKNVQNFRNKVKKVSSERPQNLSNNLRKINKKLENAYNHFDSEILDRFLQVYTPLTL